MKAFKILFISLLVFLFGATNVSGKAFANNITFTAISDVNLKADKTNNSVTPTINKLLKAADDINNSGSDCVFFLGNNISGANGYDLVMFAKILNKIQKPVYTTIGNRDVQKAKNLDKKEYFRLLNKFSKNKTSKLPCAKKINGFVFIFMDGTNQMVSLPRGYYKDAELITLEKYLNKYKNENVVIIQHFPVADMKDEIKNTYNSIDYKTLLKRHNNVIAVISGNEDEDFETEDNDGIKHINVQSLNKSSEYKVINIRPIDKKINSKGFSIKTKIISVE